MASSSALPTLLEIRWKWLEKVQPSPARLNSKLLCPTWGRGGPGGEPPNKLPLIAVGVELETVILQEKRTGASCREQRFERARIEHRTDRANLSVLDAVPFDDERRACGGIRNHIVQHAHLVILCEHSARLHSLDDGMKFFQSLEVRIGLVEGVKGPWNDRSSDKAPASVALTGKNGQNCN